MNEIEKILKDVVYGSVGAVASVLEVGGELAKTFVEKGQEAVRQGQECAEEMAKAVKEAYDSVVNDPGIDVTGLNRAQRDELRRKLDEMDAAEEAAAQAEADAEVDTAACDDCTDKDDEACCDCVCGDDCSCDQPEASVPTLDQLDAEPVEIPVQPDPDRPTYNVTYEAGTDDDK